MDTTGAITLVVMIQLQSDCDVYLVLLAGAPCTEGPIASQGRVHVYGPRKCTLPPLPQPCQPPYFACVPYPIGTSSAVLIPPVCIERTVEQAPVRAGFSTCYDEFVEVDLCPAANPAVDVHEDLGPAYVDVEQCLSSQCSKLDPATPFVDVSPSCQILVSVDVIDCLWGETWVTYTVGPVTVRYTTCSGPYETMSAAPPCTCPPPQPLCYQVNRAIAWNQYYSVDDYCNVTINLEAYCGLQGTEDHTQKAGKVTVNYQTCQPPPLQGADPTAWS
jgi:hypothetical protein